MRLRRLLYAVLPALVLLAGSEALLRLLGLPRAPADPLPRLELPPDTWIAWRDGAEGRLLEPCGTDEVCVSRAMANLGVMPARFPRRPAPGELRLFALGGSTTRGLPYDQPEQTFPGRLEALLRQAHPDRPVRVVNLGVPGMDSASFPDVAREAVELGATGLVVYAGHNEIRGRTFDACVSPYRRRADRVVRGFRVLALLRAWIAPPPPPTVETIRRDWTDCMREAAMLSLQEAGRRIALPDPGKGRPDRLALETRTTFRRNLEAVHDLAAEHGVPTWIGVPAVNLLEPPDFAEFWPSLEESVQGPLRGLQGSVRNGDAEAARRILERDPTHAAANWALGRALLDRGEVDRARELLERAVDFDYLGQRATRPLRGVIRAFCADHPDRVRCVDVERAMEAAATGPLPGDDLFVDWVHPRAPAGVEVIARAFFEAIEGREGGAAEAGQRSSGTAGEAAGMPGR